MSTQERKIKKGSDLAIYSLIKEHGTVPYTYLEFNKCVLILNYLKCWIRKLIYYLSHKKKSNLEKNSKI